MVKLKQFLDKLSVPRFSDFENGDPPVNLEAYFTNSRFMTRIYQVTK